MILALAHLVKRLRQQKRQGFACHPALGPTAVDAPAPLTRKKPDWVIPAAEQPEADEED